MTKKSPSSALLAFPLLVLLALPTLPACSAILGSNSVVCSKQSGAIETSCVATRNIPSSERATVENDCTNNGGTLVDACPTSGLIGCCTQTKSAAGVTVRIETCTYAAAGATPNHLATECAGSWSSTP